MKLVWALPCVVACTCIAGASFAQNANQNVYYGAEDLQYVQTLPAPMQQAPAPVLQPAPVAVQPIAASNPYAMLPPAYEDGNFVMTQKEQELFQKERDLLRAQQELYEREKKLASREAEFINRSKALDYKERSIQEGRSYAPVYPQRPAYAPTREFVPTAYNDAGFGDFAYPNAPVMKKPCPKKAPYADPMYGNSDVMIEDTMEYSSVSQPTEAVPSVPEFVIMQHPIQRDLVRCPSSDDVCLQSYERLGYVRSVNLSRYAAQDEVNTSAQWGENSAPTRW